LALASVVVMRFSEIRPHTSEAMVAR